MKTLSQSISANAFTIASDGFAKLSSYGDFPNPGLPGRPAHVQRVDKASAEKMAANFRPFFKKLLRAQVGLPLFKGHPDAPGLEKTFPDKTPYGTISDVEAREDGLYVKPIVTPEGSSLVEQGWKFLSSFWNQEEIGQMPDGRPITSPFELKSVGLVLRPNIPGPAINSAPESQPIQAMYRQLLVQLLTTLGYSVSADTSDADLQKLTQECIAEETAEVAANAALKTEFESAKKQVADLTSANATLSKDKAALDSSVVALTKEKETFAANVAELTAAEISVCENGSEKKIKVPAAAAKLKADADAALSENQALRTQAANHFVDWAVLSGRLPAAEKEAAKAKLVSSSVNYAAESARIAALSPVLKTNVLSAGTLDKNTAIEATDRQSKILSAVNAHMTQHGSDYDAAFLAVQSDPKFGALFSAMKQPEKKFYRK